jgi:phenylpropionate dioxygenase-like ring-hydroxylating dioxygenase large terminal subunit
MTNDPSGVEIDEAVTNRIIDHLRNKTKDMVDHDLRIPIEHFVSEKRAAAELALMRSLPMVVGHCSEIKKPGDFITREILGKPLIIVRRNDGGVAAYLNMCRHRGGPVATARSGTTPVFVCKYHGWAYDRESGALQHVPQSDAFEQTDANCQGLASFPTEERHGLIFVTLAGTPSTVAAYLGSDVEAQIEPWRLRESVVFLEGTFELDANWKLVVDGAVDSLHPPYLHAETVGKLVVGRVAVFKAFGRHGRLYQPRRKLLSLVEAGEPLTGSSKYIASIMLIYPNSLLMAAPDHVEFWTVWPSTRSPAKCSVQIRLFARPQSLDEAMAARIRKSWEILVDAQKNEDWPMEEAIQRNANATAAGSFLFGRGEVSAQHLHQQLRKDLPADAG